MDGAQTATLELADPNWSFIEPFCNLDYGGPFQAPGRLELMEPLLALRQTATTWRTSGRPFIHLQVAWLTLWSKRCRRRDLVDLVDPLLTNTWFVGVKNCSLMGESWRVSFFEDPFEQWEVQFGFRLNNGRSRMHGATRGWQRCVSFYEVNEMLGDTTQFCLKA